MVLLAHHRMDVDRVFLVVMDGSGKKPKMLTPKACEYYATAAKAVDLPVKRTFTTNAKTVEWKPHTA